MLIGKRLFILSALLLFILMFGFTSCSSTIDKNSDINEYGVFLGINSSDKNVLLDYELVVVEPSEFKKEDVALLHAKGQSVYAYLNIGAIESYRTYYEHFQKLTLGAYENWEDEEWIDVASSDWQQFIAEDLAKKYVDMDFDGFFLDNADVYYHYKNKAVFDGLCAILKRLKDYDKKLIINGGDIFVSECLDKNLEHLFDGVNQETVFTSIDFVNNTYGRQNEGETEYLKRYLKDVQSRDLSVFLLEYAADKELEKIISAYCDENGFVYYNAKNLELR